MEDNLLDFNLFDYRLVNISDKQNFFLFQLPYSKKLLSFQLLQSETNQTFKFKQHKEVILKYEVPIDDSYFNDININNEGEIQYCMLDVNGAFKIFRDNDEGIDLLKNESLQFNFINQFANMSQYEQNKIKLGYSICGEYLFILRGFNDSFNEIEYMRLEHLYNCYEDEEIEANKLDLALNDARILRLVSTVKPVIQKGIKMRDRV